MQICQSLHLQIPMENRLLRSVGYQDVQRTRRFHDGPATADPFLRDSKDMWLSVKKWQPQ